MSAWPTAYFFRPFGQLAHTHTFHALESMCWWAPGPLKVESSYGSPSVAPLSWIHAGFFFLSSARLKAGRPGPESLSYGSKFSAMGPLDLSVAQKTGNKLEPW